MAQDAPAADGGAYREIAARCTGVADAEPRLPKLASTPVMTRVLQEIAPVPATDGFVHLAYAAQVSSALKVPATVDEIMPVDALAGFAPTGTNSVISTDGQTITGKVRLFNPVQQDGAHVADERDTNHVPGGRTGLTFFDVRYTSAAKVPRFVSHRVTIRAKDADSTTLTDPIKVGCEPPVVLSPPLVGHGWWNGNGCCEIVGNHRGATLPINGDIRLPEAFAIDFVQLNANDGCCNGPVKELSSWQFYLAPVLAAANGVVVEMVNDMPEQPVGAPVGITENNAAGNHIIESIGAGRYVMYAHLHTGSIPAAIKVGAHVAAGDKIGLVGNTGSSTAPHLHFQVMDRPSPLDATGLPFVFATQKLEGQVIGSEDATNTDYEAGKPLTVSRRAVGIETLRMPAETQVFGYNLP